MMNKITKNSIIAVTMFSVVYLFNSFMPDKVLYSAAAFIVLLVGTSKVLFGISLDRQSIWGNLKFILLPTIFNVSALSYIAYLYSDFLRFILTLICIISNFYLLVSVRKVKNLGERAALLYRNVLVTLTFVSVFMASALLYRLFMAVSLPGYLAFVRAGVIIGVFALTYFATYFLSWEKGALFDSRDRTYALITAFLCSQVGWVTSIWSINYPVLGTTERATLGGTPIAAIIITITYYFLWGVISHKLDKNLNRKVLTEYFLFSIIFLVILLLTAKWQS